MKLNDNTRIILGLVAAAGIGVALAMLLSPQKGQDLRRNITHSLDDLGEKVNEMLAEGKKRMGIDHELSADRASTTASRKRPVS